MNIFINTIWSGDIVNFKNKLRAVLLIAGFDGKIL
jgi:hypothetical protein